MNWFKELYVQVFFGVFIGIALGYFAPDFAIHLKFAADIFIKSIKMLIGPIVFLTLVTGIASMHNLRQVSQLAGGALVFFLITTTLALILGELSLHVLKPGVGLNIDPQALDGAEVASYLGNSAHPSSLFEMCMNIIPQTFISAFVEGEMLQVIFISIFFAVGLILAKQDSGAIIDTMKHLATVFFKMIHLLMYWAPFAACGAMSFSIAKFGFAPLAYLFGLVLSYYFTAFIFVFVILGGVIRMYCQLSVWQLIRYFKDEMLVVWGTGSSETVLPNLIEKLELLGCKESVVGLVLPLGYSFNLAGTAIYLTMASLFIAQATNTELTFWQELSLIGILIISSKGAAGVSGSGFIILATSLATLNIIPPAGVVLVLGIDKFLNEGRAIVNMLVNVMTTLILSTWQGSLDLDSVREKLGATGTSTLTVPA